MPAIKEVGAQIVTGILIGLFGISLGFGTSQIMGVAEIRAMAVEIKGLHDFDRQTDQRVDRLSVHMDELIRQNTELIVFLRDQRLKP